MATATLYTLPTPPRLLVKLPGLVRDLGLWAMGAPKAETPAYFTHRVIMQDVPACALVGEGWALAAGGHNMPPQCERVLGPSQVAQALPGHVPAVRYHSRVAAAKAYAAVVGAVVRRGGWVCDTYSAQRLRHGWDQYSMQLWAAGIIGRVWCKGDTLPGGYKQAKHDGWQVRPQCAVGDRVVLAKAYAPVPGQWQQYQHGIVEAVLCNATEGPGALLALRLDGYANTVDMPYAAMASVVPYATQLAVAGSNAPGYPVWAAVARAMQASGVVHP